MSAEHIVTEKRDRILTIRLNRTDKKNAISGTMYKAMTDAINAGHADPDVRVILFTGTDGCFSSGNDLGDFLNRSEEHTSELQSQIRISYAVFCLTKKTTTTP